jgi:cell division protein FtsW
MKKELQSKFFQNQNSDQQSLINKKAKDSVIYFIASFLFLAGCTMVISSSYSATKVYSVSNFHYSFKHMLFASISFFLMHIFSNQENNLKKIGPVIWWFSVVGLVFVFFFGSSVKGAARWISLFGFSIQPSEFAKIGVLLEGAKYLEKENWQAFTLSYAVPLLLIILQPDLGSTVLIASIALAQLITKKFDFRLILAGIFSVVFLVFCSYFIFDHVHKRINTFLNPHHDVFGIGYQSNKAAMTMRSGGFFGRGFGKGIVKNSLPDAHTDYIFSVIIEEFGALGGLWIIFLFILLGLRVYTLSAKDRFSALVQYSVAILILAQAWLNLASNLSLIPAKGLTLPLISYGGSGLLVQGINFGILLAVSAKKKR